MANLRTALMLNMPERPYPRALLTWTQNGIITTLNIKPFLQAEWPVPLPYVPAIALRTFHSIASLVPASITSVFAVRRAERTAPASGRRIDIARAERTAPAVARRVDE